MHSEKKNEQKGTWLSHLQWKVKGLHFLPREVYQKLTRRAELYQRAAEGTVTNETYYHEA